MLVAVRIRNLFINYKLKIMSVEKWFYKMFSSDKLKYTVFILSESGDNICKMLRDDAPSNAIQEQRAKIISAAPEMLEALNEAPIVSMFSNAEDFISAYEQWRDKYKNPALKAVQP